MLSKIYKKLTVLCLFGIIVSGCAPQYTAHFSQSQHEMNRYVIDEQEPSEPVALADAEMNVINEGITIKEIVIDEKVIEKRLSSGKAEVMKPKNKEELIDFIKANPDATIAIEMDKKEKKAFKKEIKEQLKEQKEAAVMQYNRSESKLLYYILAVLLPPLAVGLWRGIGSDFWINILLTLLFYLPGIIHAIIVISNKPKMTRPATI